MDYQTDSREPETAASPEPAVWEIASGFRMSTACGNLFAALASAQGKMQNLVAQETAEIQERVFRYADLASILNMSRPHLADEGLAVLQLPTLCNDEVRVTTLVLHGPSAEWLTWQLSLPLQERDPRSIGSVITYARRYLLNGLFNVATEHDGETPFGKSSPPASDLSPAEYTRAWGGRESRRSSATGRNPRHKRFARGRNSPDASAHGTANSDATRLPSVGESAGILPERMLANLLCQRYLARSIADYSLLITTACDDPLRTWAHVKARPDLVGEIVQGLKRWCDLRGLQPEEALDRMKRISHPPTVSMSPIASDGQPGFRGQSDVRPTGAAGSGFVPRSAEGQSVDSAERSVGSDTGHD